MSVVAAPRRQPDPDQPGRRLGAPDHDPARPGRRDRPLPRRLRRRRGGDRLRPRLLLPRPLRGGHRGAARGARRPRRGARSDRRAPSPSATSRPPKRRCAGSRKLDAGVDVLYDAVTEAGETAAFSPRRRALLEELDPQAGAAPQIDYAVRDARVLARATTTAIRRGAHLDPRLAEGVESAGRGDAGARRGSAAARPAPAPTSANWPRTRSNWRAPPTSTTRSGRR